MRWEDGATGLYSKMTRCLRDLEKKYNPDKRFRNTYEKRDHPLSRCALAQAEKCTITKLAVVDPPLPSLVKCSIERFKAVPVEGEPISCISNGVPSLPFLVEAPQDPTDTLRVVTECAIGKVVVCTTVIKLEKVVPNFDGAANATRLICKLESESVTQTKAVNCDELVSASKVIIIRVVMVDRTEKRRARSVCFLDMQP